MVHLPEKVELRGIEPLTYSMRTSRATNCAIAPDTAKEVTSPPRGCRNRALLTGRAGQVVVPRERDVLEVFELGVLVVDLQDGGTGPA